MIKKFINWLSKRGVNKTSLVIWCFIVFVLSFYLVRDVYSGENLINRDQQVNCLSRDHLLHFIDVVELEIIDATNDTLILKGRSIFVWKLDRNKEMYCFLHKSK